MGKHREIILIAIESGIANLQENEALINDLNVFPVPDGDTGTNMLATLMEGFKYIKPEMEDDVVIFEAFAEGCLMGARGNSGVITSQIIRGLTMGIAETGGFQHTPNNMKYILSTACSQAYEAVANPVEGTILSVIKGLNENYDRNITDYLESLNSMTKIAEEVVKNTPEQLPVLKEAGVVDSGATGLLRVIEGIKFAYEGNPKKFTTKTSINIREERSSTDIIMADPNKNIGYCTEIILSLKDPENFDDVSFKKFLDSIGDSVVFVHQGAILKVHVHAKEPYKLFKEAQKFGEFSKIKVDNMTTQVSHNESELIDQVDNSKLLGIISVSSGSGVSDLFKENGVDLNIDGGQTNNPSIKDWIEAINSLPQNEIVLLPNNSNIIMGAEEAAKTITDKKIYVVPSKSILQGLTALWNINKEMIPFDDFKEGIVDEVKDLSEGAISIAIKNTNLNGVEIKDGNYLTIMNKNIISSSDNLNDEIINLINSLNNDDIEVFHFIYNDEISKEQLDKIQQYVESLNKEAILYFGGQKVYMLLVSVE